MAHIATASIFASLVSKRLGRTSALALGTLFLFLGTGAENILWPFQIGAMASLAGYLLALHLLNSKHRYGNLLAMTSIALSIGSAGFGIAVVIGITVQIVLSKQIKKS